MAQANLPDLNTIQPNDPQFAQAALEYQRLAAQQAQQLQQLAAQGQCQGQGQLVAGLEQLSNRIATQTIADGVEEYSGKPRDLN